MNNKALIKFIKKYNFPLGFLLMALLTTIGFILSLKLSLYGDDWLRLHILRYMFDTGQGMSYFSLWSYIGPYNAQYPLLFLVRLFWGYNPIGYFLMSLILRIIGSASFYFPLKKLTKSTIAGWAGTILIGTTPVGIQVTDWVFYMNTYLALIPLAVTFYIGILLHKKFTLKRIVLFLTCSSLFIFIIPVRSYAFFLTVMVFAIAEIILQRKKRLPTFQSIGLFLVYSVAKATGDLGPTTDVISSIGTGIKSSLILLHNHSYSFLLVPLTDFGKILFPDMFYQKLQDVSARSFQPQIIAISFLFLILGLAYYFWKDVSKKRFLLWGLINISIFPIIQVIFVTTAVADQFFATICFLILFNIFYYLVYLQKWTFLTIFLLLIVCFSLPYYLLPWSFDPASTFTSDHRYLYFPAIGILVTLSITIGILFQNKTYKKMAILIILILILINVASDIIYLRGQTRFRSEERQKRIFTSLHKIVPVLPKDNPSLFYITDNTRKRTDVYSFGFPFYSGISYNIPDESNLPFIILNLDQLHSALTDGKSLRLYTNKIKRANVNTIYFLKLLPNDTFVNNRTEVLQELKTYDE